MKAKFIYEVLDFERGKDPYKSLDIGNKNVQATKELDEIAKQFGFQKRPEITAKFESHITPIAEWWGPKGERISLATLNYKPADVYYVFADDKDGLETEGEIELWLNPLVWRNFLRGSPLLAQE